MLVVLGFAIGGGALAVADVPDSSGVIHACYQLTPGNPTKPLEQTGNVYVIDPSQGQTCNSGDHALDWKQTGPMGPRGPQGEAATGLTVNARHIKSSAPSIGHVVLGNGKSKLNFEIQSYSFATTTGGTTGSGGGAGKVKFNEFTITRKVDKASAQLFLHCANGKHFPSGIIVVRKAGKGQQEFLKYKLTNVVVSSYQTASNGGKNTTPQENITLNFTKIEFEH